MSDVRQRFVLAHAMARAKAIEAVKQAPDGFHVEVRPRTRSLDSNAKMWAMLTDVSRQVEWHGQKLSTEDWKNIFSASLKRQRAVPGLDGGFVVLGQSTSRMTVREMSDLIEIMCAFGAEKDVKWSEPAMQGYEEMTRGAA